MCQARACGESQRLHTIYYEGGARPCADRRARGTHNALLYSAAKSGRVNEGELLASGPVLHLSCDI